VTNEPTVSGSEGKESWLLPSPLSPAQRTIVVGMIVLTVVAFGKSSEGRIPDEILGYLQVSRFGSRKLVSFNTIEDSLVRYLHGACVYGFFFILGLFLSKAKAYAAAVD
jgi:hypothetical protein